ncbi:MAG: M12 family metallo-peptidase, partial [Saprospiraceae bacterium]|nr:M12 family metallo-peptidase [Saprospiraceae bacterium]
MHTNRLITPPRPFTVLFHLFLLLFFSAGALAQQTSPVANWLDACRPFTEFQSVELFQPLSARTDVESVVGNAGVLQLDASKLAHLYQTAPTALRFSIPNGDETTIELELAQVEILSPDFKLSSDTKDNLPFERNLHYRGIAAGNPATVACLSISNNGLTAMVADASGTYELGQMEDGTGNYLFYKTENLKIPSPNQCHADEESLVGDTGEHPADDRGVGCKTVQIYFECDNKLYTDKGSSTTNVNNYVTGLFNQVATLYANENIGVVISQIYVWTTPDPYRGYSSTSSVLNAFRQTRGTSFNGNLAHLLSTRSLGGGIAYVDVICFKQYAYGVSAISTSYQNVPTYSWSVEVVTHELGHNLGSWHTQSCNWPGGALDNCVSPEGSCAPGPTPVNGGTIMSYCHLTSHGINFSKGFGPIPGARVRDKVLNAACVPQSGTVPTGLTTNNITVTSATLQWAPVQGATNYTVQYKLATSGGWTTAGTSTAATYNLAGLTASSNYQWQVKTDCSNFSTTASFSTLSGGGGGNTCNTPGGLGTAGIGSTSATLFWSSVSGATSYTVQYKNANASNWTTAGTTPATTLTLTNLTALTQYNWQVKANCSNWSSVANFSTPNSGGGGGGTCNPPSNLNNNTIGSNYAVISWNAVNGATNYT